MVANSSHGRSSSRRCDGVAPPAPAAIATAGRRGRRRAAAARRAKHRSRARPRRRRLPDFAALVEHYGPAVVNVAVVGKRQPVDGLPAGMSPNDPFYEFFRRFGQPMPRGGNAPQPRAAKARASSSARDGYILTNAHVVANADEVTVKTTDRREYTAKVVGVDERTDVAVLKIDAKNLPTVRIGDPSKLRPGEWVDRDRLAVRLREQRDRGHRQRDLALHARRATTRRSSRPTSRSIPATPAARCST